MIFVQRFLKKGQGYPPHKPCCLNPISLKNCIVIPLQKRKGKTIQLLLTCSKSRMETPKERAKSVNNKGTTRCSDVFVVNFTHISFLLLILRIFLTMFNYFYFWIGTSICRVGSDPFKIKKLYIKRRVTQTKNLYHLSKKA